MKRFHLPCALIAGACSFLTPARAEVIDSSAQGFTVHHKVTAPASLTRTWTTLLDVASWWHPDHTYTGSAGNMSLDAAASGCLCETLPNNGTAVHATTIYVQPQQLLRLQGSLGPLQELAVTGVLTFALTAIPTGGTEIEVHYRVGGYRDGGLGGWAAPVDGVIGLQVQRLAQQLGAVMTVPSP